MFFYEGLSCPHCEAAFTDTDDIVACPVCGAPHHRDCWKENGGCACADTHGTEEQWSREKAMASAATTEEIPNDEEDEDEDGIVEDTASFTEQAAPPFTSFDTPPTAAFNEYTPFRTQSKPCGGVDPEEIISGEKACDVAQTVAANTPYYMPRFRWMSRRKLPFSWNWAAFLTPGCWLLFRKQYVAGSLVLGLRILGDLAMNLLTAIYFMPVMQEDTFDAMVAAMESVLLNLSPVEFLLIYIVMIAISCITVAMHVGVGLFGNFLYMKHCARAIRKARNFYPEGYRARLPVIGGTSAVLALVGVLCYQLLPSFIMMLL